LAVLAAPAQSGVSASARQVARFATAVALVKRYYVDRVDEKALVADAIDTMLAGLDPHSSFLGQEELDSFNRNASGHFAGVGMTIADQAGKAVIIETIEDGPAAKAGIRPGDVIAGVGEVAATELTVQDIAGRLRGAAGSTFNVVVSRDGNSREVELRREPITVHQVSSRLEGRIGYIRIGQFGDHTSDEFEAAMSRLRKRLGKNQPEGWVIDLRNNAGGLMAEAAKSVDLLVRNGVIFTLRGREPDQVVSYRARPKARDGVAGKPVVVLVNGETASAAEAMAGALQDHRRAAVLGTQTFGKGSVQQIYPVGEPGNAVKLTTARYFLPSGRSVQARGIDPDIVVPQAQPASPPPIVSEASLPHHLPNGGTERRGSPGDRAGDPAQDAQLQAALRLLRSSASAD
jgi:carboxyl-terminal processing protease